MELKKLKWFHSIFFKLLIFFLLISVPAIIFVGWFTYNKTSNTLTEKLNIHADDLLEQKTLGLDSIFNILVRMDYGISNNKSFSLFSENQNLTAHQQLYIELDWLIQSIETALPEMTGITMINEHDFIYSYGYSFNKEVSAEDIFNYDWFQSFKDYSSPKITKPHKRDYSNFEKDKLVFSYIHRIWDHKLNSFNYIIIDFDESLISNFINMNIENDGPSGTVIYSDNELILASNQSFNNSYHELKNYHSGSKIVDEKGEELIIFKQVHPLTNWTIVEYYSFKNFYKLIYDMKKINIFIIIICILFCLLASLIVSHTISSPIKKMQKKMIEIESGNFNQKFFTNSKGELGDLATGFNRMVVKIKELIDSVIKEEELKKEAEITALQLQINPHFIYNTLESINSLARIKKEDEISHLIVLLGRLLRSSISSFNETVTIRQEISYAESYLEIQKIRMRHPLNIQIFIDPAIENYSTIKWILQPIIENAIVHGIDPLQSTGEIKVSGRLEENHILFEVSDKGVGIEPSKLMEIRHHLKYKSAHLTKYKNRIGLYNVQTRISSHFGKEFGIEINSTMNEGTTVFTKIPIMKGDLDEENANS